VVANPRFFRPRTLQDMEYELAQLRMAETLFQEEGKWAEAHQCSADIVRVEQEHRALCEHIICMAETRQMVEA
jgi:hypothetical protein